MTNARCSVLQAMLTTEMAKLMLLKDTRVERFLLLQRAWWPVENGYIILPDPVLAFK